MKNICHEATPKKVQTTYTDELIYKIIELKRLFYSNSAIAKYIGVKTNTLKKQLYRLRKKSKWRKLIPYIKPDIEDAISQKSRIGSIDIEFSSTNFKADRGFILTYAILDMDSDKIYKNRIQVDEIRECIYDKRLVKDLVKDLENFDEVVEHYGTKCDLPFIRTRALIHRIPFFHFGSMLHYDLYYLARRLLSLHRNTLESVCEMLGIKGKNHFDFNIWQNAICCKNSIADICLDKILDHNVRDVTITKKAYKRLINYAKGVRKSI